VGRASGGGVEFQALGPIELVVAGHRLDLGPARQRAVLTVLLVDAGRVVPVETLVDRVWGDRPPRHVRNVVYTYVTRLRRILEQAVDRGGQAALLRRPGGYMLDVDPTRVDLHRFRAVVSAASDPAGDEERATALREALDLWHGPPLAGVSGDWAARVRSSLEQQRVAALSEWSEVVLRLGRPAVVIEELQQRLTEYPLAEPLMAHVIRALYDDGRQAEALARYAEARHQIAEELGVEPGEQLRRVYEAILHGRPNGSAGSVGRSGPAIPVQVPGGPPGFSGRATEVGTVRALLSATGHTRPAVAAISGVGGVGKSALALHVAHMVASQFPHGQLYVDLQGARAGLAPLDPEEALGRFLRALGDQEMTGKTLAELSARFRELTAARRLLVVLDNARDAAQVRPLQPTGAGCAVIVTSREVLATLDGATHIRLDVMAGDEAVALLGRIAGAERIQDDLPAAEDVAGLCGHLPLALRIAGARLVTRPGWPVRALADRLTHAARRLDELQAADLVVRSSLAVSHQALVEGTDPTDRAAASAFPLLGLPEWPHLCVPAVARMLDRPEAETERMLERLVDAQLVQSVEPGRYRLHDLLRLYAREVADDRSGAAALRRAMEWYLAATWQTFRLVRPGDPRAELGIRWASPSGYAPTTAVAALDWLDSERPNLLAIVAQAAATPDLDADVGIGLGLALPMLVWVRGHWRDWLRLGHTALTAASRAGDRTGEAYGHHDLGAAYERQGDYKQAQTHFRNALAIFIEVGDRHGQAACLYAIGMIYCQRRDGEAALDFTLRSLSLRRTIGDRRGESTCLRLLGSIHYFAGRFAQAGRCHQEALDIYRELGDRHGQATALSNTAEVRCEEGDYSSALAQQEKALDIFREVGDRYGQAVSLNNLGRMKHLAMRYAEAVDCYEDALTVFQELGIRQSEAECLHGLAAALQALGQRGQADLCEQWSSTIYQELEINAAPN
jgi:DNA-binding SARP family transcriptional activator/tetratricopeptide (TPR) repeat protein